MLLGCRPQSLPAHETFSNFAGPLEYCVFQTCLPWAASNGVRLIRAVLSQIAVELLELSLHVQIWACNRLHLQPSLKLKVPLRSHRADQCTACAEFNQLVVMYVTVHLLYGPSSCVAPCRMSHKSPPAVNASPAIAPKNFAAVLCWPCCPRCWKAAWACWRMKLHAHLTPVPPGGQGQCNVSVT